MTLFRIMKKNYIAPELTMQLLQSEQMIATSITNVGGNSSIEMGTGETPEEADAKGNFFGDAAWE